MRFGPMMALAAAAMLLAGCATEQEIVQGRENVLAAAGFTIRLANTPARQQELATLPPHRFVFQERDGKTVFVYADPLVCHCLYIGDEQAYRRYQQMAFQQQIADQQLQAAQMNWSGWSWGPWGPGFW